VAAYVQSGNNILEILKIMNYFYIKGLKQHNLLFIELARFFLKRYSKLEIVFFSLKLKNYFLLRKVLDGKIKFVPGLNYHFYIKSDLDINEVKSFVENRSRIFEWFIFGEDEKRLAFNMVNIEQPIIESTCNEETEELKILLNALVASEVINEYEIDEDPED